MAAEEKTYQRMPGKPFFPFVSWSLWQGPDHLLWVSSLFFRENYRRFYYDDIQSIVVQQTGTQRIWTVVWGALALFFAIIAIAVSGTPYVSGTFLVIFISALLVNILLGPSCAVFLQTAVQLQKISSLRRMRTADKALDRIKALVHERQGGLQEKFAQAVNPPADQQGEGAPGLRPAPQVQKPFEQSQPKGPFIPLLHQIMFGVLLATGVSGLLEMALKSLSLGLLTALLHSVSQIMVIVALVRWFRHLKGSSIAKLNWLALVLTSIYTVIGNILYFVVSFRNPELTYDYWALFKIMFELTTMNDHFLALAGSIIFAGGNLLLGALGLLALKRQTIKTN